MGTQQSKEKEPEPCKKEACLIQACLSKNDFRPQNVMDEYFTINVKHAQFNVREETKLEELDDMQALESLSRCLKVIELLQSCCEKCNYNSTHCASLSGLLKQKPK